MPTAAASGRAIASIQPNGAASLARRSGRAAGPAHPRRCRGLLHRSAAGGRCCGIEGSAAACPTPLSSFTAPASRSGAPRPCCGDPRGPASPTSPCAFCSWRGADRRPWRRRSWSPTTRCGSFATASSLLARPPDTIRGKMEVRGIGIVEVKSLLEAELALVVDLVPAGRDRAAARGRCHDPPAGRRAAPDRAVPLGSLGSHQAGDRTGARETQLILYG